MRISGWSSDVCSSDLRSLGGFKGSFLTLLAKAGIHGHSLFRTGTAVFMDPRLRGGDGRGCRRGVLLLLDLQDVRRALVAREQICAVVGDRKSTRLNSSH